MEHNKKRRAVRSSGNVVTEGLIGGGIGAGTVLLLLLLLPILLITFEDPNLLAVPTVCLAVFIGGAVCGIVAANRCGESPLLAAVIGASAMLLPIFIVSLTLGGTADITVALLVVAVLLASSAGGAFLTQRFRSDKKRNMKKALKRR